jgi:hypothetical protein
LIRRGNMEVDMGFQRLGSPEDSRHKLFGLENSRRTESTQPLVEESHVDGRFILC